MCERIKNTGQAVIRHNDMVFVAPLKGDMKPMEYEKVYTEWLKNEVMGNHRFPNTACACNSPELFDVEEEEIEINGENVTIIANKRK